MIGERIDREGTERGPPVGGALIITRSTPVSHAVASPPTKTGRRPMPRTVAPHHDPPAFRPRRRTPLRFFDDGGPGPGRTRMVPGHPSHRSVPTADQVDAHSSPPVPALPFLRQQRPAGLLSIELAAIAFPAATRLPSSDSNDSLNRQYPGLTRRSGRLPGPPPGQSRRHDVRGVDQGHVGRELSARGERNRQRRKMAAGG